MDISSGGSIPHSGLMTTFPLFCYWQYLNRQNDTKPCFYRICNIALSPQSLRDAPPLIHQTFMISVGGSVTACGYCGGIAPRDI